MTQHCKHIQPERKNRIKAGLSCQQVGGIIRWVKIGPSCVSDVVKYAPRPSLPSFCFGCKNRLRALDPRRRSRRSTESIGNFDFEVALRCIGHFLTLVAGSDSIPDVSSHLGLTTGG